MDQDDDDYKQLDKAWIEILKVKRNSRQKELHPHGSDRILANKGTTPFAEYNIQYPVNARHPDHNHVAHQHSIVSAICTTKVGCSSQHTLGYISSNMRLLHMQYSLILIMEEKSVIVESGIETSRKNEQ